MMGIEDMVKKYLITSAQLEAQPNYEFLKNLELYAQRHDAQIVVLPLAGTTVYDTVIHEDLQKYVLNTSRDYPLNQSLKISNYEIKPQQINPLTGIKRFAQGDRSFIFGSPKQHLEYVANDNDDIPKAVLTTGSITHPYYKTHTRVGRIAEKDHEYGAVIVEIEDNKTFHFRHIKALKSGRFFDVEGRYHNKKHEPLDGVEALVIGDLHPNYLDPEHKKVTFEQIKHFKPKRIFLHDAFDGISISHHNIGKNATNHMLYEMQGLNLGKELKHTYQVLKEYCKVMKPYGEVFVVKSNHDEHLNRYLEEGRFIGDKGNDYVGAQLYLALLEEDGGLEKNIMDKTPLKYGLELQGKLPKNLVFLNRQDGYKLLGYQLGNHGDLGKNGGKGSVRSIEEANGKSITGHTHSPLKYRDTYRVGTSSKLRMGYNRGYSSWVNTNAVMYSSGQVQLLNTIRGKWKT